MKYQGKKVHVPVVFYTRLLFLFFSFSCSDAENVKENSHSSPLFSLELATTSDKKIAISGIQKNKASVFVFLAPECPLCEGYSLTINALRKEFEKDSILFYGVFPGSLYTLEEMRKYQQDYSMSLPCMLDPGLELTHALGATITPEVFVLDKDGNTLYSGRIDNWAFAPSKKRTVITEHNLRDALASVRNGQPVIINSKEAVGCVIEY